MVEQQDNIKKNLFYTKSMLVLFTNQQLSPYQPNRNNTKKTSHLFVNRIEIKMPYLYLITNL